MTPVLKLREALTAYFNVGELRTLCFELGIEYEDLEGVGKAGKALALVQYAERHGRFQELYNYVRQERPHIGLDQVERPPTSSTAADSQTAGNDTPQSSTTEIHIHGNVIGSAIAGGTVKAENIAGGDISIGGESFPATRETFSQKLAELELLLKEAIESGEISSVRDAETAVEDLQDVSNELKSEKPRSRRLTRRLEDVSETLKQAATVTESAGKVGTAVLKAAPIVAGLIKLAGMIF